MDRIPGEAPLDVVELKEIMGGDGALMRACLDDFSIGCDAWLGEIRDAAGRGDREALERAAHALKGSLLYLAARPAADAAFELERAGRRGELMDLESKLVALEQACGKLRAYILGLTA